MHILLKDIRLVSDQKINRTKQDIYIKNGKIQAIGYDLDLPKSTKIVDCSRAYLAPGCVDIGVQACDPGYEHREDLHSAMEAAAKGGFSAIAVFPNTNPALHGQADIQYIQNKAASGPVEVFSIGALSEGNQGVDLAEIFDMHQAGAKAFSDGQKPISDAALLYRALSYSQAFDGLIFDFPQDATLVKEGQMHEGLVSTQLGMKGIPNLSEVLAIQRDIEILAYTGGRLHLHLISTAEGVEIVRKAKARGLNITASAAVANLCFTDEELLDFDSNWKLSPPLRSENDRLSLIEAAKDGTLDFLCSNHIPWDEENKNLEFPYAKFGQINLQTALALCLTKLKKELKLPDLVRLWSSGPRTVLGIELPTLEVGASAKDFTLFFEEKWTFNKADNASLSRNSPFFGTEFSGFARLI